MNRLRLVVTAAVAAVASWLVRSLARFEATDASMEPTIREGDYLVATRVRHKLPRFALVVIPHPGNPDMLLVKRAVAVDGDRVQIEGGRLGVNEQPVPQPWATGALAGAGTWDLESGEMFVLSDNRTTDTADSRTFGPVAVADGVWRVRFRYWPITRIGGFSG